MASDRVFFAFDYELDLHRARRIHKLPNIVSRAPGGFETSKVWREARRRGHAELRGLIDDALMKTSVTVVCIAFKTAYRAYVRYAIKRSLQHGNGLVGIKVNKLKDEDGSVETLVAVPPEIEAAGFNVYSYTYPERLIAHIEEAHELSKIDRPNAWHGITSLRSNCRTKIVARSSAVRPPMAWSGSMAIPIR